MNRRNTFFELMRDNNSIHRKRFNKNKLNGSNDQRQDLQSLDSLQVKQKKKTIDSFKMSKIINSSIQSNTIDNEEFKCQKKEIRKGKRLQKINHFFIDWGQCKNQSTIGFTTINPLITNSQIYDNNQINVIKNLKMKKQGRLNIKKGPLLYQQEMDHQIINQNLRNRYPHGILGIDHPENKSKNSIYQFFDPKVKVREVKMSNQNYQLSPLWKSKKTFPHQSHQLTNQINGKRSFHFQKYPYNIISNRLQTNA